MSDVLSLLPSNASRLERALEMASSERDALPIELIFEVWDPQTCPAHLLPYLAWGLGLEIWSDQWSEAKQRATIAKIWKLKRDKTTLRGIGGYLDLVDAAIVKAVRPRDKVFAVDSFTPEEQAAYEAALPQVRIFPMAQSFPCMPGMDFWGKGALGYGLAFTLDDAGERFAERGEFIENGVTTRCVVTGAGVGALDRSYLVRLAGPAPGNDFFADHSALGQSTLYPDDAGAKVIAVDPDPAALHFAVPSGLAPTTVRPLDEADVVPVGICEAFDFFVVGRDVIYPDDAAEHIYQLLRFYDPSAVISARGYGVSFWDWSSFGCAPFTSWLTLDVRLDGVPWGFPGPLGLGVVYDPDLTPLWDALWAVRVAQAARDDIFVSTTTEHAIEFVSGRAFGAWSFGDYERIV